MSDRDIDRLSQEPYYTIAARQNQLKKWYRRRLVFEALGRIIMAAVIFAMCVVFTAGCIAGLMIFAMYFYRILGW